MFWPEANCDSLGAARTDLERPAAIGFCFGDNVSVEVARGDIAMKAEVGFHGGAVKPDLERGKNDEYAKERSWAEMMALLDEVL